MSPTPPYTFSERGRPPVQRSKPAPPPRDMESFLPSFFPPSLGISCLESWERAGGRGWGDDSFFPGGHLAWGNGWAGTALSPPGQAGKRQELLSAPTSACFRKRRPASERKLLIRSRSAYCCRVTFHPPKSSTASVRPSTLSLKCKCLQA